VEQITSNIGGIFQIVIQLGTNIHLTFDDVCGLHDLVFVGPLGALFGTAGDLVGFVVGEHSFCQMGMSIVQEVEVRTFEASKFIVGCRSKLQKLSMFQCRVQSTNM